MYIAPTLAKSTDELLKCLTKVKLVCMEVSELLMT